MRRKHLSSWMANDAVGNAKQRDNIIQKVYIPSFQGPTALVACPPAKIFFGTMRPFSLERVHYRSHLDKKWEIAPEGMIRNHFRKSVSPLVIFIIQHPSYKIDENQRKKPAKKGEKPYLIN